MTSRILLILLPQLFIKHKSKMAGNFCGFKFLRLNVQLQILVQTPRTSFKKNLKSLLADPIKQRCALHNSQQRVENRRPTDSLCASIRSCHIHFSHTEDVSQQDKLDSAIIFTIIFFSGLSQARSWTFAIGFTLSIGGLTAKLWMAYSVLKERFVRSRVSKVLSVLQLKYMS